jgi:hypothetical protein
MDSEMNPPLRGLGPGAQQLDQVEQALEIQQARVAMALQLPFAVGGSHLNR